tara:strand:+ start:34478 stop:34729 length:252 start_codon:yes stop_codon:yes gene_type:complete
MQSCDVCGMEYENTPICTLCGGSVSPIPEDENTEEELLENKLLFDISESPPNIISSSIPFGIEYAPQYLTYSIIPFGMDYAPN